MKTDTIPCTTISDMVSMAQERLNSSGIENARQEAELFISHACGFRRLDIYLNGHMDVSDTVYTQVKHMLQQRSSGVPLAYILGNHEFMGIPLVVDRRVLIPRPETECLVENVLEVIKSYSSRTGVLKILDIGTGSGAIAVALAMNLPHADIIAVDISMPALLVARHNSMRHNLQHAISFIQADSVTCFNFSAEIPVCKNGDECEKLTPLSCFAKQNMGGNKIGTTGACPVRIKPWSSIAEKNMVDIIISNPPYVRTDDIRNLQKEIQHEPRSALDGGVDGIDVIDRIIRQSSLLLRSGGYCALEIDPSQVDHVRQSMMAEGYTDITVRKDYGGCDRMVIARIGIGN